MNYVIDMKLILVLLVAYLLPNTSEGAKRPKSKNPDGVCKVGNQKCGSGIKSSAIKKSNNEKAALSPVFYDLWGFPVNWTDSKDGWDEAKRKSLVQLFSQAVRQPKFVPAFTHTGYKKADIPPKLYQVILKNRLQHQLSWEPCLPSAHLNCDAILANGTKVSQRNIQLMALSDSQTVRQEIVDCLKPILESWTGIQLSGTSTVYGIRRYLAGSWLSLHVDKWKTHVVSAILQIDQKVDQDWPLTVVNLQGEHEKIYLQPGQMLLYESAKVPHGRQFAFRGGYFDNIFVHFKPKSDCWYKEELAAGPGPSKPITKDDLM